jgi:hypothetical protein
VWTAICSADVRYRHLTENPVVPAFVRYWTKADILALVLFTAAWLWCFLPPRRYTAAKY